MQFVFFLSNNKLRLRLLENIWNVQIKRNINSLACVSYHNNIHLRNFKLIVIINKK